MWDQRMINLISRKKRISEFEARKQWSWMNEMIVATGAKGKNLEMTLTTLLASILKDYIRSLMLDRQQKPFPNSHQLRNKRREQTFWSSKPVQKPPFLDRLMPQCRYHCAENHQKLQHQNWLWSTPPAVCSVGLIGGNLR